MKYNKMKSGGMYDAIMKYMEGGMMTDPKAEKLKLLKQQLSAAKNSQYATEKDKQEEEACEP